MRPTIIAAAVSCLLALLGRQVVGSSPARQDTPDPKVATDTGVLDSTEKETQPLVALHGQHSHITEWRVVRITTAEDWQKLWSEHVGTAMRNTSDTEVGQLGPDFNQVMVIAVFRGKGGCYPYIAHSILETTNRIYLRDIACQVEGAFTPNLFGADSHELKASWGIAILPRSNKELILQHEVQTKKDGPTTWNDWKTFPALEPSTHLTHLRKLTPRYLQVW